MGNNSGMSPRKAMASGFYKGDKDDHTLKGGGKKMKYVTDGDHHGGGKYAPVKQKPKAKSGGKSFGEEWFEKTVTGRALGRVLGVKGKK